MTTAPKFRAVRIRRPADAAKSLGGDCRDDTAQGKPWHSFTGTEFVVVRDGRTSAETAATAAARLCVQPVSRDGRTRWPVPLHMARIADADHPAYRSDEGR